MQSKVDLQPPFSYSLGYIFIFFILLLICCALLFILYFKKKRKLMQKKQITKQVVLPIDINKLKVKYLVILSNLENRVNNKQISDREAYIELSEMIRTFVFEATNIKVQNCTLQEIDTLKMPLLSELIREYYSPEFAYKVKGDINLSINKTKEAIQKWN